MQKRPLEERWEYAGATPHYTRTLDPDLGDIFTLEEFREMVDMGAFIASDGTAHFVNKDGMEDDSCYGWDFESPFPADAVKVAWYNK
jgi:hypothetical protein